MFTRLDAAFRLFLRRLPTAAMIVLTIWLPANLLHNYLVVEIWGEDALRSSILFGSLVMLLLDPLVTGALFYLFAETMAGRRCGYGQAMAWGLSRWGLLFATRLVVQLLTSLGLLLLILPGIYLMARWALAECAVVFEGATPSEARQRSTELTEGRRMEIFLAWQLPLLAFLGLSWYGGVLLEPVLTGAWLATGLWDSFWSLSQAFVAAVLLLYWRERA